MVQSPVRLVAGLPETPLRAGDGRPGPLAHALLRIIETVFAGPGHKNQKEMHPWDSTKGSAWTWICSDN
jgi:hypothetical protein